MSHSRRPSIVITGASSGIGRATAHRFADGRARLVLAVRSPESLETVAAECRERGAQVIVVPTDVADPAAVDHLAERAVDAFGGIDVWVNDAGVASFAPFLETPLADIRRVIDVDLIGVVHGSRAALAVMTAAGSGVLINVSSVVGEIPQPYAAAYAMAKAAVRALGVSLRSELAIAGHAGVRVSTVMPATIDTPFFQHSANYTGRRVKAVPPVYTPEMVARTITRTAARPRPERVVGLLGTTFVRMHRLMPRFAEAQMAALTHLTVLSGEKGVADSTGILYGASELPVSTTGGWHGARRRMRRQVLGWSLVAGAAALVLGRARGASR